MKLEARQGTVVHLDVRGGSGGGIAGEGMLGREIELPVAVLYGLGIVRRVGRARACDRRREQDSRGKRRD